MKKLISTLAIFTLLIPVSIATASDWNTSISLELDAQQYAIDDTVNITLTLTNTGEEDLELVFPNSCNYDYELTSEYKEMNDDGELEYTVFSDDSEIECEEAIEEFVLTPDESIERTPGIDLSEVEGLEEGETYRIAASFNVVGENGEDLGLSELETTFEIFYATFSDITDHWGAEYIEDLYENGIVSGYDDGTFMPNQDVTRAEFLKMVMEALGYEASSETASFLDVTEDDWYYDYVNSAWASGLIAGYQDGGVFLPDQTITRAEAMSILTKALGLDTEGSYFFSVFEDVTEDWQVSYVMTAYNLDIVSGYETGGFGPNDNLTRAQAAKIVSISKDLEINFVTTDRLIDTIAVDYGIISIDTSGHVVIAFEEEDEMEVDLDLTEIGVDWLLSNIYEKAQEDWSCEEGGYTYYYYSGTSMEICDDDTTLEIMSLIVGYKMQQEIDSLSE